MREKSENLRMLLDVGVMPVIRTSSAEDALRIVDAIRAGEIPTIEITMTIPNALTVLETAARKLGDAVLVAAGTVLDSITAREAIAAGAQVVISPCCNRDLLRTCRRYSVIAIPGAATPTEILNAWEMGADIVKVFPAGVLGGPSYIKAIRGPLPQVLLNPTGGVNLENAGEFIKAGASLVSIGSALIEQEMTGEKHYKTITNRVKRLLTVVRSAKSEDF